MHHTRLALLALLLIPALLPAAEPTPEQAAFFEKQIRPLFAASCFRCHGPKIQEAGLRLDSYQALLKGGTNGPVVVVGEPGRSLLLSVVRRQGEVKMPPNDKLGDEQIAALEQWVKMGIPWPNKEKGPAVRTGEVTAADREFWSLQPVRKPAVPDVKNRSWAKSDIDRFVLARLEAANVEPAGDADRRTLLRRVTFDLTGLPPTPAELDAFRDDTAPDAFAKVIDRLLASPAYGERWGRHWLDVVRYADTAGETADYPVPEAYRYRNYVIDSFNRDKPYDQFVREQIAGDLLTKDAPADKYAELVTATGFIAISRRFGFDPQNYQHLTIQDTIDTTGQAILGLSVGCARCHSHKFDPVTTADYYAWYGIFASTTYAFPGSEEKARPRDFVPLERVEKDKPPTKTPLPLAYGVSDGKAQNAKVQKRGDPLTPGDEVPRRNLTILGGQPLNDDKASGRLDLARWLTDAKNPLTARVFVNRVWQHHFGNGLVATENDFGARGQRPTHPELLDYLAARFVASGWSVKALHRDILLSHVYQLSADAPAAGVIADPTNRLLGRHDRQRLEAEAIRDSLLLLGGNLDREMAGPHPFPPVDKWGFTQHAPFSAVYETTHRSVYLMTPRLKRHPFLALFDGPDPNASTAKRGVTTVPTQALFFLNDPFVHEQSAGLASRLLAEKVSDAERVKEMYRLTLAREPRDDETRKALAFVEAYSQQLQKAGVAVEKQPVGAWAALVRTLFARNEFVFID